MAVTTVSRLSPMAQKKWGNGLAVDVFQKSYFTKKFIGVGDNNIIEVKTELEKDTRDTVSFDLSVQLRGTPTRGDDTLLGKEEALKFYTDEVKIDQMRHSVSKGGKMSQKRVVHNLRKVSKDRLSDYWSKYMDELYFMYLSGARGMNEDYFEATDFTGHAGNPIQAPDNTHLLYGGDAVSKATLEAADKMSRDLIVRTNTTASMLRAQNPDVASINPVTIEGENRYVLLMSKWQSHDLKKDTGDTGWATIQKAIASAEGNKSKLCKGGLGMIDNTVLHDHESVIRFDDYGAGSNVQASRALFMGRQAAVVAFGVPGKSSGRFFWEEETTDYKNKLNVAAGTIAGLKKTRFNGNDYGVIALDTAAKDPRIGG